MEQLIKYIAFISLITACTKTSVPAPTVDDSHEIIVSIADSQFGTKCTLDSNKTYFSSGDQIMVISMDEARNTKTASYKYVKTISDDGEKFVFQKNKNGEIDTNNIVAAVYPSSSYASFDYNLRSKIKTIGLKFPEEQSYTLNKTQTISAPMVCFTSNDNKFIFSNFSCLLRIGIKCKTEPVGELFVSQILVSSKEDYPVCGVYEFIEKPESVKPKDSYMYGYGYVPLINCETAGALSQEIKYYYIFLPPLSEWSGFTEDDFCVKITLSSGKYCERTFTSPSGTVPDNRILKNRILQFPPIEINPEELL